MLILCRPISNQKFNDIMFSVVHLCFLKWSFAISILVHFTVHSYVTTPSPATFVSFLFLPFIILNTSHHDVSALLRDLRCSCISCTGAFGSTCILLHLHNGLKSTRHAHSSTTSVSCEVKRDE